MKQEYKFLIELCNDIKEERDEDGNFDFRWWKTLCDGYETPKSEFVETTINLCLKKDKDFPKKEFLKQVNCSLRGGRIYDRFYEKQARIETNKIKREQKKEERKWARERQKYIDEFGYDYFYYEKNRDVL